MMFCPYHITAYRSRMEIEERAKDFHERAEYWREQSKTASAPEEVITEAASNMCMYHEAAEALDWVLNVK